MGSAIKKVKFKPGLPLEIEVIPIAATIAKHAGEITAPHRSEFYHVFWIQTGSATYYIDFEPVVVKAPCFFFISKDRVKVVDQKQPHDGKALLFTDIFFAKSDEDRKFLRNSILFNDLLDTPVIDVSTAPALPNIFTAIEEELSKENDAYHFNILHNLLHNLLLTSERERRKQGFTEIAKGSDLDYTILFKDLLEQRFKHVKSVSGYASQINVSEKRLGQATNKAVGISPKAMIDERVMLEAKRLLVHANLTIKEIGYELGFEEPTNFIKYFRKHAGETPLEFKGSFSR